MLAKAFRAGKISLSEFTEQAYNPPTEQQKNPPDLAANESNERDVVSDSVSSDPHA
jgi:hypothetical protein